MTGVGLAVGLKFEEGRGKWMISEQGCWLKAHKQASKS